MTIKETLYYSPTLAAIIIWTFAVVAALLVAASIFLAFDRSEISIICLIVSAAIFILLLIALVVLGEQALSVVCIDPSMLEPYKDAYRIEKTSKPFEYILIPQSSTHS